MPSKHFKQRQKQRALEALRSVPKPIPGWESILFATQVLPIAPVTAVAEAAPDGGMILPEDEEISMTMDLGHAGGLFRYSIQGLSIPAMPVPIKIQTA